MALKWVIFAALVLIAKTESAVIAAPAVAAPLAVAAPVVAAKISDATYDAVPQYSFGYDVQDALTGDSKAHVESRNGDIVQGQYSLNDPDGTRRIVDYTADPVNGFNVVIRKAPLVVAEPLVAKTVAAPVVAKAVAAPLIARTAPVAAPLTYAVV